MTDNHEVRRDQSVLDRALRHIPVSPAPRPIGPRAWWTCAAVVLLLVAGVVVGMIRVADRPGSAPDAQRRERVSATPPAVAPATHAPVPSGSPLPVPATMAPQWTPPDGSAGTTGATVSIPVEHVVAPVDECQVVDQELEPPNVVARTCEWMGGAPVWSEQGTTVIAGHINWVGQGTGALGDIGHLVPGDTVLTASADEPSTTWRVVRVIHVSKSQGVDPAAFVGPDGDRQLYLITCGGAFDASSSNYLDNIYVRAVPVGDYLPPVFRAVPA